MKLIDQLLSGKNSDSTLCEVLETVHPAIRCKIAQEVIVNIVSLDCYYRYGGIIQLEMREQLK